MFKINVYSIIVEHFYGAWCTKLTWLLNLSL